ncbi:MFS transporter [Candidatus Finniella inopinata]|uniref:MFS transporter n=1 Tax=Candidatus Finniella inopinata TaxID=1696036 RepID=A0A4Q7DJG8_9PROT|nr:MFS transporter [Candidatus Finniella inopinata]RZI47141.1 MFS transporter [Candidatus Finniella inopinata]
MCFFTIFIMYALCGAEIDLFVPSFPELQQVFHLSPFMVELTLGVNLVAHCLTSLVVGSLGDRFGRKAIILIGLSIFTIGSLCCVYAPAYWILLLGRLLQGIGISGPAVLSYVIIADIYSVDKQQQLMGFLNGVIAFAMAFAPVIGSYVSLSFHWQGNFVVLLIMGLISLIMGILFLPASKNNKSNSFSMREYQVVLRSSKALYYISTVCFLLIPYWFFVGISPILYMEDLGVSLEMFGFYQGSMAMCFSVFSISSSYFIKKFGQRNCLFFGLFMVVIFMLATFALLVGKINDALAITLAMQLLAIGVIFPINILYPLCLDAVPDAKGKISALVTSGRLVLTAINLQIAGYIYNGTFMPIGTIMILALILGLWFCYQVFQKEKGSPYPVFASAS